MDQYRRPSHMIAPGTRRQRGFGSAPAFRSLRRRQRQRVAAHCWCNDLCDRSLGPILCRPRLLQAGALLIAAWVVIVANRGGAPLERQPISSGPARMAASPQTLRSAESLTPIDFITAYTTASIAAGATAGADELAPFFTPASPALLAIQQEYARRAATGERHQATLVRWGLLTQTVTTTTATIETQEQWNDTTLHQDQVVAERRGLLQRVRYQLARPASDQPWLLVDVTSTTVVQ